MILRSVMKHVRDQNWVAVGLDFLIVVVGVFVGLQVQQWAEGQRQARMERFYTERLQSEVSELQATRAPIIAFRNELGSDLSSATAVLFGETARPLTARECRAIVYSYIVTNPTDELASLIELQSSGQFFVFSNKRVSAALRSYLLTRSRVRDSQAGISRTMKNLSSEYPELINVVEPMMVGDEVIAPTYRCDVYAMRASQAFLNDFDAAQSNYGFHVLDNARIDRSLAELENVLTGVLGPEPEPHSS